ncbi:MULTISPECIES: DUF2267 domain-containing protein [unclassified Xanthobacter]|uniref:DUF2267 domain-containing protein n=1 Tax=unclassified Xanthobacter TaxID=2623496 RepID=UPI001F1EF5ED|nr:MULTISPECIES: DUF2267 domain-containing protein [unclassified Xanthobacter]
MPRPFEYQHASEDFDRFLCKLIEQTELATRNQAYTTVQGVLYAFRRRLTLKDAIRFAGVLPPILRAIFVADWNVDEVQAPFEDRSVMTREAQSLRKDHNFSPATCIRDVAAALRSCIDEREFDRVLASLPPRAAEFWDV